MLTQQTLEKLYTMKLNGMADAFRQQQEDTAIASLSFEERFGLLVDQQWIWKETRALSRRLAGAKFKLSAAVEDIDFRHARGLDRKLLRSLTSESSWVRQHLQHFSFRAHRARDILPLLANPLKTKAAAILRAEFAGYAHGS